jgi:hypothetical protein
MQSPSDTMNAAPNDGGQHGNLIPEATAARLSVLTISILDR